MFLFSLSLLSSLSVSLCFSISAMCRGRFLRGCFLQCLPLREIMGMAFLANSCLRNLHLSCKQWHPKTLPRLCSRFSTYLTSYCVLSTVSCILYNVCTLYYVLWAVYCVLYSCSEEQFYCALWAAFCECILYTAYCILCTAHRVLCTVLRQRRKSLPCAVSSFLWNVYSIQYTVYSILCTVHCVLCPVYYSRTAKKIFTVCCLLFSVKCIITIHRVLCVVYTYAVCCNYNLVSVWCILCAELLPPWTDQASVGSVNLVMKNIGGKVFY